MEPDKESYERALRQIPQAYSLALRLRAAAVDDDQICEYLDIDPDSLRYLFQLAEAKLATALREKRN